MEYHLYREFPHDTYQTADAPTHSNRLAGRVLPRRRARPFRLTPKPTDLPFNACLAYQAVVVRSCA
ncbi:hypothetical protein E2H86_08380 [Pseudomonas putida]|uniref:hypothetical protein n=1 Tax=Pseudomonas putida TaxID=303 RepID=UPI001059C956|nr:hypothetical protein [Pseudomonas putida]TDJ77187.1 hypothetical protein E2H86_08380 [Pseudomonas putida]